MVSANVWKNRQYTYIWDNLTYQAYWIVCFVLFFSLQSIRSVKIFTIYENRYIVQYCTYDIDIVESYIRIQYSLTSIRQKKEHLNM